jgi:stage II sporulation SpoAA-like protein
VDAPADEIYFSVPGVASVRWDHNADFVRVEWEGWANSDEFARLLQAEVTALKEHHGSRLLADCRRQKVINPADQERANQEWVPRALAAGLKRFAVVIPSSALAEMNLRSALDKIPGTTIEVGYFATVEEAEEWLAGTE